MEDKDKYGKTLKDTNKLYRRKKNEWIEKQMEEIEKSNSSNRSRVFYKKLKKQRTTCNIKERGMKNEHGEMEYDAKGIEKIWMRHFQKLLNREEEETDETKEDIEYNEEEVETPSKEEILETIDKMKNGKAPGVDGIEMELIKHGGEVLRERICDIIRKVWEEERMPEEWSEGEVVVVRKKGSADECANYRGITLLGSTYKVVTTLLHNRLIEHTKENMSECQYGFIRGRSTVDAIHVVKQVMEKCHEHDIDIHLLFVDFRQAFDRVIRKELYEILKEEIPGKLQRLIKMTLEKSRVSVRTPAGRTTAFEVNGGVRQGDALSATLFNLAIRKIIRETGCEGWIINKEIEIVAYADDVVIIARSLKRMIEAFRKLARAADKMGLKVNDNKTKYMKCDRNTDYRRNKLIIDKHEFEEVEIFCYLGVLVDRSGRRREEIESRIKAGNRAFYANKKLLVSKQITKSTKIKIYRTLIRPVVTYAAETLSISMGDEERLRIFERKVLRTILGPKKETNEEMRRLMNHEILEAMSGEDIVKFVKAQRIGWLGHIMRASEMSTIKAITMWKPSENRPRGRPRIRWKDQVEQDLRNMNISRWNEKYGDRGRWRRIVEEAKSHPRL